MSVEECSDQNIAQSGSLSQSSNINVLSSIPLTDLIVPRRHSPNCFIGRKLIIPNINIDGLSCIISWDGSATKTFRFIVIIDRSGTIIGDKDLLSISTSDGPLARGSQPIKHDIRVIITGSVIAEYGFSNCIKFIGCNKENAHNYKLSNHCRDAEGAKGSAGPSDFILIL